MERGALPRSQNTSRQSRKMPRTALSALRSFGMMAPAVKYVRCPQKTWETFILRFQPGKCWEQPWALWGLSAWRWPSLRGRNPMFQRWRSLHPLGVEHFPGSSRDLFLKVGRIIEPNKNLYYLIRSEMSTYFALHGSCREDPPFAKRWGGGVLLLAMSSWDVTSVAAMKGGVVIQTDLPAGPFT